MKFAIGIGGKMHSGKDTVASMLKYINNVGVTKAKYSEWWIDYSTNNSDINTIKNPKVVHFADKLKDLCSITFGIQREFFDSQTYKDLHYYNFRTHKFISIKDINETDKRLNFADFNDLMDIKTKLIYNPDNPLIKIRTLMQIYADAMKQIFGNEFFTNLTIKEINDIVEKYSFCLIPDVRYKQETYALKQNCDFSSYIILINRPEKTKETVVHNSEVIDINPTFIINNDGTLIQLFYKVIDVYNEIINFETKINQIYDSH